ncbi:DUF305 domain-containing protein [Nocardia jinanensis]|uniref:DUF305 domain-containing protein n=1 Tax=Nocardia jinanensis TaxID=382504 RepID=A0A917RUT7_9NOCA|nr:DUF305 domain-containing protein [Nocardia jinanensis]GGL36375.1 DUF305 domain-containing protein [Nocardia jinanensis]
MPDADTSEAEPRPESGLRAQLRGQRTPLLIIAAIALLVIGFGAGVLLSPDDSGDSAPGPVDIGFAQDMSAHHTQAVEMSGIALLGSTDPAVQRLAYDILTTQQSQIGRMQGWLQMWGAPARGTDGYMGWMHDAQSADQHGGDGHDHDSGMHETGAMAAMPGMASTEDIQRLRDARGTALDVLFLQLMLRHHEGGVPMLEYGAEHAGTGEISILAGQMLAAQQGEARLITDMLTARGGRPLPLN